MILVYVCPRCKDLRIVSRRKEVSCTTCGSEMGLSDLTFLEWSDMTQEERKEYGAQWCAQRKEKEC